VTQNAGGNQRLSADRSVAGTSSDVTVTGPPGETVLVITSGPSKTVTEVKLDTNGKATVRTPGTTGVMTVVLKNDWDAWVEVVVVSP
jgi:hypothetical protein